MIWVEDSGRPSGPSAGALFAKIEIAQMRDLVFYECAGRSGCGRSATIFARHRITPLA
jgi:hypothetical protein